MEMEEGRVVAFIDNSLSAKDFLRCLSVSALLRDTWKMSSTVLGMAILTGIFFGAFRHLGQIQTALHDPFFMGTAVLSGVFYGLVCAALDQIIEGRYGLKQWQETHDYWNHSLAGCNPAWCGACLFWPDRFRR